MASTQHEHRDVKGGAARAAVFGVSDGLVSNVGLILGMAGADASPSVVRIAGIAGLVAGAVSMAAGEYNSMRVQAELLERELAVEAAHLRRNPQFETEELAAIYRGKGMEPEAARNLAEAVMADPDVALETHAREELGIDPDDLGSPLGAGVSSFVAFSIGAVMPLVPWFFGGGVAATVASIVVALSAAIAVGLATARFTERPPLAVATRQVLFTAIPAAITYGIGTLFDIGIAP